MVRSEMVSRCDDPSSAISGAESVDDVEGVAQRAIERGSGKLVETPNWFSVDVSDRDREDVVARDDARFGKPMLGTEFDLGADAPDRSRNRGTGNRSEHTNGGVSREYADWRRPAGGPRSAHTLSLRATTPELHGPRGDAPTARSPDLEADADRRQ